MDPPDVDQQLAVGDLAWARQQGDCFSLELICVLTPPLDHSTPFRSSRSLAKVSTNSGEPQNAATARSISPASRTPIGFNSTPSDGATDCIAPNWPAPAAI